MVTHKSPNQGLPIAGCLARLERDNSSADHPVVDLSAAMAETGATVGRLIEEQPDRSSRSYRDYGARGESLKRHGSDLLLSVTLTHLLSHQAD